MRCYIRQKDDWNFRCLIIKIRAYCTFYRQLTTKQIESLPSNGVTVSPPKSSFNFDTISPLSSFLCANSSPKMWPSLSAALPLLSLLVWWSEFSILNEENDKNSNEKPDKGQNGRKPAFWRDLLAPKCILHYDWLTFRVMSAQPELMIFADRKQRGPVLRPSRLAQLSFWRWVCLPAILVLLALKMATSGFPEKANFTWSRDEISGCECSEKPYRHVHCPCLECNGRATDRKTELLHWKGACEFVNRSMQSDVDLHIFHDNLPEDDECDQS